ncbi:hypothetical protein CaCOL14_000974 [Colletotrichum acutatum]
MQVEVAKSMQRGLSLCRSSMRARPADERPEYFGGAARLLKQRDDRFLSTPSTSSPDPGFDAQADGCIVRQSLVSLIFGDDIEISPPFFY